MKMREPLTRTSNAVPETKTILEYERTRRRRSQPWWRRLFIWDVICLFMWGMTIIGSISMAVGLASFVIPIDGLALHGKRVETVVDRLLWMVLPLICAGS